MSVRICTIYFLFYYMCCWSLHSIYFLNSICFYKIFFIMDTCHYAHSMINNCYTKYSTPNSTFIGFCVPFQTEIPQVITLLGNHAAPTYSPGFVRPDFSSFLCRADGRLPSPGIPTGHFLLVKSSSLPGQKPMGLFPVSEGVFTGDTDWLLGQPVSSRRQKSASISWGGAGINDGRGKPRRALPARVAHMHALWCPGQPLRGPFSHNSLLFFHIWTTRVNKENENFPMVTL